MEFFLILDIPLFSFTVFFPLCHVGLQPRHHHHQSVESWLALTWQSSAKPMQFRANRGSSAMTRWKTHQLATKTRPTRLEVWHKFRLASLKQRIISQRIITKYLTQMLRQQNLNCSQLWTLKYWGSSWLTSDEAFPPDLREIFYVFTGASLQHVCGEGERQKQKKGGRDKKGGGKGGREIGEEEALMCLYSGSSVPGLSLACAVDLFVRGKYLQRWIKCLAGNFLSSVERAVWFFLVVYGKVRKQTNRKWIVKQKESQMKELENSQPCPYWAGHIIYRQEYQGGDWIFPYFLMDSHGSGWSLTWGKWPWHLSSSHRAWPELLLGRFLWLPTRLTS